MVRLLALALVLLPVATQTSTQLEILGSPSGAWTLTVDEDAFLFMSRTTETSLQPPNGVEGWARSWVDTNGQSVVVMVFAGEDAGLRDLQSSFQPESGSHSDRYPWYGLPGPDAIADPRAILLRDSRLIVIDTVESNAPSLLMSVIDAQLELIPTNDYGPFTAASLLREAVVIFGAMIVFTALGWIVNRIAGRSLVNPALLGGAAGVMAALVWVVMDAGKMVPGDLDRFAGRAVIHLASAAIAGTFATITSHWFDRKVEKKEEQARVAPDLPIRIDGDPWG